MRTALMGTVRAALVMGIEVIATASSQAQGQQDFSKVEIKATKIAGNFYTLEGQGGTMALLHRTIGYCQR